MLAGLAAASMEQSERSSEISMQELAALVETAGGQAVGMMIQNRPTPDPRSFIGEGKVAEIKELIGSTEATMAIFDNDLSPSQMRVLTEDLGVQVLDRSGLILDIFAQRAQTREGQLQVELAQYQYLLPRLTGMWTHLVRQTACSFWILRRMWRRSDSSFVSPGPRVPIPPPRRDMLVPLPPRRGSRYFS